VITIPDWLAWAAGLFAVIGAASVTFSAAVFIEAFYRDRQARKFWSYPGEDDDQ
jgi:hypothetical protein